MDIVFIRDLSTRCTIGVYPRERMERQEVLLDLELYTDARTAGAEDDLVHAVDYEAVTGAVLDAASGSRFMLLEALAEHLAEVCLSHPNVRGVKVRLTKPGALSQTKNVGVEITRP